MTYRTLNKGGLCDDYRSKSIEELNQFTVYASFVRLAETQTTTSPDLDSIDQAIPKSFLSLAVHRGRRQPTGEWVAGRYWIHFDRTASKFAERTGESYATLIDERTLLSVAASYSPAVRLNASWLESRRAFLVEVRDHVVLAQ
jgi:hypothetical protein